MAINIDLADMTTYAFGFPLNSADWNSRVAEYAAAMQNGTKDIFYRQNLNSALAGESITAGQCIRLVGTNLFKTDIGSDAGVTNYVGIALESKGIGEIVRYTNNKVVGLTGLTPGATYYLGENGQFTIQRIGQRIVEIGVAKSVTELLLIPARVNPINSSFLLPGMIIPWLGTFVPSGFYKPEGQNVVRGTDEPLYFNYGNTYGPGNGAEQTLTSIVVSSGVATATFVGHGLSNGDNVGIRFTGGTDAVNRGVKIFNVTANTFDFSVNGWDNIPSGTVFFTDGTTFPVPDMRGGFMRAWNNGGVGDPDAATRFDRGDGIGGDQVGTLQFDALQGHYHNFLTAFAPFNLIDMKVNSGASATDQGASGNFAAAVSWTLQIGNAIDDGTHGTPNISNETRPLNKSFMLLVKR